MARALHSAFPALLLFFSAMSAQPADIAPSSKLDRPRHPAGRAGTFPQDRTDHRQACHCGRHDTRHFPYHHDGRRYDA